MTCLFVRWDAAQTISNHKAVFDEQGILKPWTSWRDAVGREMKWYANCPTEHGYPRFVVMTFMDGSYNYMANRPDMIPATQHGMGILSYLKYYAFTGSKDAKLIAVARAMGDYLIQEDLTPNMGKYPRFTRSTGKALTLPQPPDCGCQADRPYEIEPDKGGIAGYALVVLYEATHDKKYLAQALQNGHVLAANMRRGDDKHSPWPFRADYRTGEARGEVGANTSFTLRLFDKLLEHGYSEFRAPRAKLWNWIKNFQIPNLANDGSLWVQFFEDYEMLTNRNSWSALNLARYLLEKKQAIDPDWKQDATALIEFVSRNFTSLHDGVPVCGEQDDDKDPWGGANSTYGAVVAMFAKATHSAKYKSLAYQALNFGLYSINDDGCPRDSAFRSGRGGWQEDAHTDKIHNYVDAMTAFPEWAN